MGKKFRNPNRVAPRRLRIRRHNAIIYALSAILITVGTIIILKDTTYLFEGNIKPPDDIPSFPPVNITPDVTFTASPIPSDMPEPTPVAPQPPVYVYFPQYSMSCPVDPVGYTDDGSMDTIPAHDRAGWLYTSGTPTSGGNILIAGHNKYHGNLGYFSIIHTKMSVGDQVILEMENGEFAFYVIESITKWKYDEIPPDVLSLSGTPRLTLITCFGDYSYTLGMSRSRVVAICVPVMNIDSPTSPPDDLA